MCILLMSTHRWMNWWVKNLKVATIMRGLGLSDDDDLYHDHGHDRVGDD